MPRKITPKKSQARVYRVPEQSELPATQGMLGLVRKELKSDIRSLRSEMRSGFARVDARFSRMEARFDQIDSRFKDTDSRFKEIDARFNAMDAKFEQVLSEVARIGILVEEQNSRNRVALEGLTGLWERQDRVETRINSLEDWLKALRTLKKPVGE